LFLSALSKKSLALSQYISSNTSGIQLPLSSLYISSIMSGTQFLFASAGVLVLSFGLDHKATSIQSGIPSKSESSILGSVHNSSSSLSVNQSQSESIKFILLFFHSFQLFASLGKASIASNNQSLSESQLFGSVQFICSILLFCQSLSKSSFQSSLSLELELGSV